MRMKHVFLAAAAVCALGATSALAQSDWRPDPDGYYSRTDHDGYYDRSGHYRHFERGYRGYPGDDRGYYPGDRPPPPAPYREGAYGGDCHSGNATAGTVLGAVGGGLVGSAASHGNAGAVVGGAILGGILGNAISRDIDCDDQRYAFDTYSGGLNGDIGRRYEWRHNANYGYFTPTREYYDRGLRCREFTTVTYRGGQEYDHTGVACYESDGYWHFR
ncbi:MAG: hypothetical protein JO348_02840 [Alphaproteobacteria bacterium]|nr:hypothetical protein [Alphaproteobacteria bacterium]MBV9418689.1 hypothetical protein [Alphaproteobacteria bacterium]MBV9542323.1 hypothetical protein [Alphaproteobacteria bacterium]MBV9904424.1 hypothetical protein [Alphaproteobacteria bacterium]